MKFGHDTRQLVGLGIECATIIAIPAVVAFLVSNHVRNQYTKSNRNWVDRSANEVTENRGEMTR